MNALPRWYYPVTIAALLWNLLGCAAYLSDVMLTPDDLAKMSAAQQTLYASRPGWGVAATAIAVWGGALGCVGLLMRKRWALWLLVASLIALVVQDFGLFVLSDVVSINGPIVLVLQGLVLVVAVALVWLARRSIHRGWIR